MDAPESLGYRDYIWAIELNRWSLELIGLWPKADGITKKSFGSIIRTGFIFIMITFVLDIPLVHALVRVWGDMTLMIDNLRVTLPMLMVLLKFSIMQWKQSVLLSVLNMIREDWITLKLDSERDVMVKRVRIARLIITCTYVLVGLTVVIITIFPYFGLSIRRLSNITDRNKPLPLQSYYFYNTDKSPHFELTYFSQVTAMLLGIIIYMSADTFLIFVIFHICGQIENFRCRLVNFVPDKEFNKILSYHVVTHLRLVRYVNNIEDIFTLMMLGSIIYFGIILCLAVFVLLVMITNEKINATNFTRIYYMIVAIFVLFMQMFFYCYAGELITEENKAVYHALYDLEWYKWNSKQARNLIILMIRVQEPLHITAGRIVPLTMTTFCNLLKTSAGYVSFLMAIQD
ncbi:odorant receptor 10-like isoform X2 [Anoplolepis gracilipes]|uniref:odorant receptor 10-like isoform X2 n=1 Tax=Anoplolepis gracilipes TaxID=354296 RepID=UPI003B9DC89B